MAERLGISFPCSITLDPNIMKSREERKSIMDTESNSSRTFKNIVVNLKKKLGE